MADGIVTPGDIKALKTDLVEAVINAYMAKYIPGVTGLKWDWGSCAKGEFRFKDPGGVGPFEKGFYCYYPEGNWKRDDFGATDPNITDGDGQGPQTSELFDAKEAFAWVEEVVSTLIDPWSTCPSPNVFNNQIISMTSLIEQLYVGDTPYNVPADGVNPSRSVSAITYLSTALDRVDEVPVMSGAAITHLRDGYTDDVRRTISGQYAMARTAGAAIAAECVAWANTFKNLKEFIEKATDDFNSLAESHGAGDSGTTLTAVSAIITVGAGGAGVIIPPAAAALTAAAGVAALGSIIFPDSTAKPAVKLVLSGSSFTDYLDSFAEGIFAVDDELRYAEQAIAAACDGQVADFRAKPNNYSISLGKQESGDSLTPFYGGVIDIDDYILERVAGAIETIGDHQKALCQRLLHGDSAGNPTAYVANEWERGAILGSGSIGDGGAAGLSYKALVDELGEVLANDQRVAHRVSDRLVETRLDFRGTNDDIKRKIDGLALRLVGTEPNKGEGSYIKGDDSGAIRLPEVNNL